MIPFEYTMIQLDKTYVTKVDSSISLIDIIDFACAWMFMSGRKVFKFHLSKTPFAAPEYKCCKQAYFNDTTASLWPRKTATGPGASPRVSLIRYF